MKKKLLFVTRIKFFLLAFCFCSPLTVSAQDDKPEWLNVWQKDGTCVSFKLQEHPRARMGSEKMFMETSTGTLEYSLSDIQKFTFGNNETGIKGVSNEGIVIGNGQQIVITGAKPNTEVSIYSLNGIVLGHYRTDADGRLSVSAPNQGAGVVLLNVGGITYKIATK